MLRGAGVYLGAGRNAYVDIRRPGAGHRLVLLAQAMGIPTSDPSEVPSLVIAQEKARIEGDIRVVSGFAHVIGTAFGKFKGTEWFETLQPPREIDRLRKEREERDALLRSKAMLCRIQMMQEKYQITEVRE